MRRGGRSTGTLRITAYLDQLSFAPMDHVAATPRHNHHHHCMEEVKQHKCHFLRAHYFWVIKFKLDITWLVHFGRAWKRLNINGLHFIICQVILRGVWCRKWEGFAKFFLWMSRTAECVFLAQNEAGEILQGDEIQSESVHQLSVENIQRMERNFEKVEVAAGKLTDSWMVNFQISNLALRGKIVIQQNLRIKVFRTFHFYRIRPAVKAYKESTNALAL